MRLLSWLFAPFHLYRHENAKFDWRDGHFDLGDYLAKADKNGMDSMERDVGAYHVKFTRIKPRSGEKQ